MTMKLIITKTAAKSLRKMPVADAVAMIEKLEAFAATGEGDVKKLVGSEFYRLRHGQWRAVFELEGDVIVLLVGHRREIYG